MYEAPHIDAAGMYIPTYYDTRDKLIEEMKGIFGQDIYLEPDSQDYQQISIMARKIHDVAALGLMAYNDRTPITSVGVGLDNLCALVGITRNVPTASRVEVTITGAAGTVITDGKVSDGTYVWNLPHEVTIASNGIITVEAVCAEKGHILAPAGTINIIQTPTYGWTSVTNSQSVTGDNIGANPETDATLRQRYDEATTLPSNTVFEGMIAALKEVHGVSRVKGYENDTGELVIPDGFTESTNEDFPPHSVTFVVEGGDNEDIAREIYFKKTPGCYTNGATRVNLMSDTGNVTQIRFYRPEYVRIYAKFHITPLTSYTAHYEDEIKENIKKYIEALQIAEDIRISVLNSIAIGQMADISIPAYAIQKIEVSTDGTNWVEHDITMNYKQAATVLLSDIEVLLE